MTLCTHLCILSFIIIQSTLLQCLLGELIPKEGSINIRGTISYAAQEPWLFSETLRENILFGKPYNAEWYNTVVKACALSKVELCGKILPYQPHPTNAFYQKLCFHLHS